MNRLGVLQLPPGCDARPSQLTQHYVRLPQQFAVTLYIMYVFIDIYNIYLGKGGGAERGTVRV